VPVVDRADLAPGRRRALAVLAAALVLAMTTWFSASAVVPQLRAEWSLGDTAAAWLTIAVQLGFVAGALLSSVLNLADVIAPRVVILAGAAGAAAANVLLGAVSGAGAAIPLRFLTGFFLAGVYPPALKLMATWFRRGRGTALGILVGALTLGSAMPHLVNGLGGLDWHTVVYATSALTLAGGLLALAVPDGPYPFPEATFDPHQARRVFANRGVRLASLGYFGHMWELYAMWAWFVVFYATAVDDGAGAAYATFAVIAAGALGCWVGGILGDRIGRPETTALAMAVSGTCALLIGLFLDAPAWAVLAIGLVWGFTVVADSAQFSTLVTEHADQAYVGTALTMQLALGFTLTVATIWLLPFFADAVGWRWAFAFLAPGPALGVLAMLRLRSAES
jgi:MFS family permease